jgi:hypothetical protein
MLDRALGPLGRELVVAVHRTRAALHRSCDRIRDLERLCLVHGLLQLPDGLSWPVVSAEQRNPFAPPPLQGFTTTMGCSAPALRFGTLALAVGAACGFFLGIGEQDFSRSVQEPNCASRRLHAGCRSGGIMTPPKLIPEVGSTPGFGIA